MTELLQLAFSKIEKLSESDQNEIARRLLTELEDENVWRKSFGETTEAQWQKMAAQVDMEIAAGNTAPLSELFTATE